MKIIRVSLGKLSYPIFIGKEIIKTLPSNLKKYLDLQNIIILTNPKIKKLYQKKIDPLLKNKLTYNWLTIPEGENYKNLKTVEKIYHRLLALGANRKTGLIALGGGVIGDIAGFVAATYMRGIPYIQIPTTLLAQVDSSVGGKTGVDLPEGKNLVGAFYQPRFVLTDTDFLNTLPKREFLCGLSEVVKYGIIWDARLFSFIENNRQKILDHHPASLEKIIARACQIKAHIVSKDEKEAGLRALLNFGHTLGHAIEVLSGYKKIHHGEAVARGMVYAAGLSSRLGLCLPQEVDRIKNLLEQIGLPIQPPSYSRHAYQKAVAKDKKSVGKKINFIALKKLGKAVIHPLTSREIVRLIE